MKKVLSLIILFCGISLANATGNTSQLNHEKSGGKATKKVQDGYMCGDFVLCGTTATICGATASQRVRVFEYAVECCCGDGTTWA